MTNPPHHIDLTDDEMKQLEAFAKENDMTPEEAASFMAASVLRSRYTKPRTAGVVVPFNKRGG